MICINCKHRIIEIKKGYAHGQRKDSYVVSPIGNCHIWSCGCKTPKLENSVIDEANIFFNNKSVRK